MSKAEFQLAFDGPALKDGTMDVNELATSLLAVGDLVREANQDLNMDKAEATLLVRSDFKKGSFEVALLIDQSLIEHAKGMLFPAAGVLGRGTLVTLLFGTDAVKKGGLGVIQSVTDIWKKCKGEKPKSVIEDKDKGISILVFGDGNQCKRRYTSRSLVRQRAHQNCNRGYGASAGQTGCQIVGGP